MKSAASERLDQLQMRLEQSGSQGKNALRYIQEHHIQLSFHDQPTAARWTLDRQLQLHPRYLEGEAELPYALSLIVHEVLHLQQGFVYALSVQGELEAWQLQFTFLKSLTGFYHPLPDRAAILTDLMGLKLNGDRSVLRLARRYMQAYAGPRYRIDLLPLYPIDHELLYLLFHESFKPV